MFIINKEKFGANLAGSKNVYKLFTITIEAYFGDQCGTGAQFLDGKQRSWELHRAGARWEVYPKALPQSTPPGVVLLVPFF